MRYQEESDSYLKKGMKDEAESYPRPKGYNQMYRPKPLPPVKGSTKPMKPGTKTKVAPPVAKNPVNKKKLALGSMLGSLSSGASFRNQ